MFKVNVNTLERNEVVAVSFRVNQTHKQPPEFVLKKICS